VSTAEATIRLDELNLISREKPKALTERFRNRDLTFRCHTACRHRRTSEAHSMSLRKTRRGCFALPIFEG
jgi:hypothetical protein